MRRNRCCGCFGRIGACQICRSRFWIDKKKYRHCNLATPDPSPPTRPPAIANPMPPKPFCLQIDSYGMGWLLARIGCQPRGSQRDNWLRDPQRFAARICYSCRCHALPLSYAADTVAAAHTVAAAASLPLSYAAAAPLPPPLAAARYLQKTLIILTIISIK